MQPLSFRFLFIGILITLAGCAPKVHIPAPPTATLPPTWELLRAGQETSGVHGMVASDAPLASEAGVAILKQGGNAIDAAVATAFALAVVMPEAGNIGGGGFLVLRLQDGTLASLDFREKAPLAARRDMYLDAAGTPTDLSITGHLSAGVPGSVAGLYEAHRKYGRLPWQDVVAPAVRLAHDGFPVSADLAGSIREDSTRLVRYPASAALFLPEGRPVQEGSMWKNQDLARCLQRVAERGPQGFYEGETARLLVEEMRRGKGIITAEDLRSYSAVWREPVTASYRQHTIVSMPPPSSGGMSVAMIANILEAYDLRSLGWHSPEAVHLAVEAMRRTFADRNHFLGDPDFLTIPQAALVSKSYAAERRESIDPERATPSADVAHGTPVQRSESMHTTHFSVADSAGNVVALTTTINHGFGSAVTVTGAGFLLNNEMDDFASKPGSPNAFGLVQGEANAIAPGKRILSSMSPTIVIDPQGEPLLVTGASGGPRIITAVFQVVSNVIDFGGDISFAVTAPRFHHQHLPDLLLIEEGGFSPAGIEALHRMGHATRQVHHLAITPSILRKDGAWRGGADPRMGGAAVGY